jgi:hypothetical protein
MQERFLASLSDHTYAKDCLVRGQKVFRQAFILGDKYYLTFYYIKRIGQPAKLSKKSLSAPHL